MQSLLIDGYNFLHVTDVRGEGAKAGTLEGARDALLAFLAARLTDRQRKRTRIVFDAAGAPPGLPKEYRYEGMRVLFARDYPDADAMLEALIEQARAPKELLVVSGDHRVQRAARRRGAEWIDSDAWRQQLRSLPAQADPPAKPSGGQDPSIGDVDYWVREFSRNAPSAGDQLLEREAAENPGQADPAKPAQPSEGVFPPGYAQDLEEEWEQSHPPARDDPPRGRAQPPSQSS